MRKREDKQAETAAMLGVVVNILLALLKIVAGIAADSRALIADAVHSGSDVVGSFAIYIGLKAAKQPPDEEHPYGHGKAESIAAIIVSVLLAIVGLKIGLSSFEAFYAPTEIPGQAALYVIVFSIIVKEAMFRYKYNLGKRIGSKALIVNAYEHRSDVFSSIAALIGVAASLLSVRTGLGFLAYGDPAAGLIVSLFVLKMAFSLGKEAIVMTMDRVLPEDEVKPYKDIVSRCEGVEKINSMHAREHGRYVIIDLKIAVLPHLTVEEGHKIGKKVKAGLLKERKIQDVFVHINPLGEEDVE